MTPSASIEMPHDQADRQARALAPVGAGLREQGLRAPLVERVEVQMRGSRSCRRYPPEPLATVTCELDGFLVATQSSRALSPDVETAVKAVASG
ncbi:hypothetical protein ACIBG8_33440 [Nonomuraea sp. NPDC050556]|uniref:hypothetical protein n=1 Tax=Nonomuraea sp. NPDC050556 TaxID=3364369 RepID=UPI0037AFAF3C